MNAAPPGLQWAWADGLARLGGLMLALVVAAAATATPARAQEEVDAMIVLAVDCSYSVDDEEFRLQRGGLAEAFRQPEIVEAIRGGPRGRIMVSVVQWSDADRQIVVIPWMGISDAAEAMALADRIEGTKRTITEGGTSISAVMRFAAVMLMEAPVTAERRIIDISGDGRNNTGGDPQPVRDRLSDAGITINGLAILNEVPTLDRYFESVIVGGPGHFVVVANDYSGYREAVRRKLLREISEPHTAQAPQ